MDYSPPGSSVHAILQARILRWVAIPFSRGSSQSRDWTQVSCIAGRFFTTSTTWEAHNGYESESEVSKSCLSLCNPVDWSPPGSSIHGILQARILEWVAISFSGSSQSRDWTQVSHIAGLCFTVWATSHFWKKTWPSISNSDFPTNCPFSPSHCFCVKSGLFDSPQLF